MRANHRSAALALVAAVVLAMTSACGGSDKPKPLSTPKAQEVVKVGVLTAADMPGYKAEDQEADPDDEKSDEHVATCLGLAKPSYVARNPGRSFTKGDLEVESTADVASSASQAKAELKAFGTDKAEGCLKDEFNSLLKESGGTISRFELTPQTISVKGADDTFAYKLDFGATIAGQNLTFSGIAVGALVGQVELEVNAFDPTGSGSFGIDQAVPLLQKVVDRTKAEL